MEAFEERLSKLKKRDDVLRDRGKLVHISNLTDEQLERYIILREDLEDEREPMNDALAGYDADY